MLRFLLYFLFIGAGYILIEVGLIQKFVLFLGHPTYALTVVIFSMLISSGLGSFASRRLLGGDEGRLIKALGCVALLAALLALLVSGLLLGAGVAAAGRSRWSITVALIAPLGFVMGMPFPTALRRLEEVARALGALGVVAQRRVERAGIGGRAGVRHLPGADPDADHRRPVLSGGAGGGGAFHRHRDAGAGTGSGAGRVGPLTRDVA